MGSGLSKELYPDWPSAVTGLCSACAVEPFDNSRPTPTADELLDKAEECKRANANAYEATLAGYYGGNVVQTRQAYLWLMQAPFKAYVTTNLDPLLSEAANALGHRYLFSYPLLPAPELERCTKPLFYAHGHARRDGMPTGRDLVLARSEFDQAYRGVVRLFVENLLLNYPIVFIGCRLSEPDVHQVFRRVHEMHTQIKNTYPGYKMPPRIAVLPARFKEVKREMKTEEIRDMTEEQAEAKLFLELDTVVLRYAPVDRRKHWEIEDVLEAVCRLSEAVSTVSDGKAAPR